MVAYLRGWPESMAVALLETLPPCPRPFAQRPLPLTLPRTPRKRAIMASYSGSHVLFACLVLCSVLQSTVGKGKVKHLNEDNWMDMISGEWMVEFYAPWCPACKGLEMTWKEFAEWSDDLDINVGAVDVTANPGLSGRFMVTALPTIFHVKDGSFRQYRGSRDKEEFIGFIEEKKWQNLEEIPGWKSPNSIQMNLVAYFFRLSMVLRSLHTQMIEEYGLPYWGSYLVFALATIIIGAILGLVLVCIIDFVFPPKSLPGETSNQRGEMPKSGEGDGAGSAEDEDIIEDDSINSTKTDSPRANDDVRKRKSRKDK